MNTGLDLSILNSLGNKTEDMVLNYFASSREWKVENMYYNSSLLGRKGINRSGYLMAHKRNKYEISHFSGPLIIFDKISDSYKNNYKFINSKDSPLNLTINEIGYLPPSKQPRNILRNVIIGKDLNLLIDNEYYNSKDSENILSDLNSIVQILRNINKSVKTGELGDIIDHLDSESYKNSDKNELIISQSGNYIKATGYVNIGKKGSLYLKIIKTDTGYEISHPGRYNEEYIGWSEIDSRKFYFELNEQHIIYGNEGDEFDAELQLWFNPLDNSEDFIVTKKVERIKIGYRGF
ncbi:MAG: hypothetical protein GQ534_05075 [Candidatus Delongbacteria bacterium]|nr:hypothetical protein [Candidatus Delongbacteria bacterium]